MVSIFSTHLAQTFLLPSSLMMAITAGFSIPIAAHNSLVVMWWSFRISASTLSLVLVIAAVAGRPLHGLSPTFLPPLLKRHLWPHHHTHFSDVYESLLDWSLVQ
jgi:hypothetical protein